VRILRTLPAAGDICAQWDWTVSVGKWCSPIQHYMWTLAYAQAYGAARNLRILALGSGGTTAIAPLFRPKGFLKPLELIGVKELFEVMDFIYAPGSDLESLIAALLEQQQPIVLRRIRKDSLALATLRRTCARDWITFCHPSRGGPFIRLDESWKVPDQHINGGRRSDLRRARRTAENLGPVCTEILSPAPGELPALLDEAYAVEASGWKGRERTALHIDRRLGDFYRRYATLAAERGMLRLCFLRINGKAAAMQIAVVTGDAFWLLKIGYSDEFARCSPGVLLMMETISYAAAAGLASYEFLGASESWIRTWTSLEHECVSFRAYPLTPRGLATLAADALPAIMRSLNTKARGQR
jgi:CelD/BcsL family acetyltransferase involved in cellulose biosynthesis